MITKETIMEAYLFMRKENESIPRETLEFMKDTALAELEKCKIENLDMHSVSEIRGKLTPIVNLIAMIENGVPHKSDRHHEIYLKEIENCKRVINDLAQREVYSR